MRTKTTGNRLDLHRLMTWERWQFIYIALSLSWLFAPSLNRQLSTQTTFISHYEDPGQPWSLVYRASDILAAIVLGLALLLIFRRNHAKLSNSNFYRTCFVLLGITALGFFVDDAFPSACHAASNTACLVPAEISRIVHTLESIITSCALILLNVMYVIKRAPWAKTVLFVQLLWSTVFIIGQLRGGYGNSLLQFGYQLTIALWIAHIVPRLAGYRYTPSLNPRAQKLVHLISAWIFFGGFVAVVNSIRNVKEISQLSSAYFGDNTAWLSQHGVAVGIVLMYVSRHLWRGEYRAWQLTSTLLWLEALKYAVITPDGELVALYGLMAATLFVLRGLFDRVTSVEQLQDRLKKLLFVGLAFVIALFTGVLALRLKHHQDVDSLKINFVQFARHFFLTDIVNDLGPPSRRLLGQVLNVAGITLLITILLSLFRPYKPLLKPANQADRKRLLDLLSGSSTSSEDYFKYWPQPKSYWWNTKRDAVIAYRVTGNVAFALADPVARTLSLRKKATKQFLEYCRQYGWRACFLMVPGPNQALYKQQGYKLFRIGASAIVDIEEFNVQTGRNKWWRWVLNKAKKQRWQYELSEPPHASKLISELRAVSSAWLQRQNHKERGFALGYFDPSYLQACRLHLLRHNGKVIAFANELPGFNNSPTATIDLMRFLPDYKHAMPTLLAYAIQQLQQEGIKQDFDLGFVPLASPAARTEQIIQRLGQLLMGEAISAQGLEQFKNKFSPSWHDNYIAFDGDWIDLLHITRQLDTLLKP